MEREQLTKIYEPDKIGEEFSESESPSLFFLSLAKLKANFIDQDVFLTPNVVSGLNYPRPQYVDYQDMRDPQKTEITEQVKIALRQQLITHLGEHALNRNLFESEYGWTDDGRLKSPFQESEESFCLRTLRQVIVDSQEYLVEKFGVLPNEIELAEIDRNFEELIPKVFSRQFMETRAGLELAEYWGLRRFEELAKKAKEGEVILMFSPYSPHRGTAYEYQFTNLGIIKENGNIGMIYGRTEKRTEGYLEKFRKWADWEERPKMAWQTVSWPILLGKEKPKEILGRLGVETNPEIIALFDRALLENMGNINELIKMMTDGKHSVGEVSKFRQELEKMVVVSHKRLVGKFRQDNPEMENTLYGFLAMVEKGYLRGGLCGFADLGLPFGLRNDFAVDAGDGLGPIEFECPNCHKVVTRPFGGLVAKCPWCNGSCRC